MFRSIAASLTLSGLSVLAALPASAVAVEYTIDSAESGLGVTGNLAGELITYRSPVNFLSLSGTLQADRTGNTVTFSGGSAIAALQSGNYTPGIDGDFMAPAAKANFAIAAGAVEAAVRDLYIYPFSPSAATIAGNGKLALDAFEIAIEQGGVDFLRPDFQGARADLATTNPGQFRVNLSTQQASITQAGGIETLVLPFKFDVFFSVYTTGDSQLTFTGELTATTAETPEPGTLLAFAPLAVAGLARRRRR
jgi:MYXO-CTERM domain-containing protein